MFSNSGLWGGSPNLSRILVETMRQTIYRIKTLVFIIVPILLALLPLLVTAMSRKSTAPGTSIIMFFISLFALPALYAPVMLLGCMIKPERNACYGNGWSELMTIFATSLVAIVVLLIVCVIAARSKPQA